MARIYEGGVIMKWFVRLMLVVTAVLFIYSIFYLDQKSIILSGINMATFFMHNLIWSE